MFFLDLMENLFDKFCGPQWNFSVGRNGTFFWTVTAKKILYGPRKTIPLLSISFCITVRKQKKSTHTHTHKALRPV